MTKRLRLIVAWLTIPLVVAACSNTGASVTPSASTSTTPATTQASSSSSASSDPLASLTCDVKQVGPVVQCENFYSDYWPVMKQKMQELLPEAQKTADGNLVIWGWFEVDQATKDAFAAAYPGIKISSEGLQYNMAPKILAAAETGGDTTDILGGNWVSGRTTIDKALHAQIDWTKDAVPAQFLDTNYPWFFPDGMNGWLISYNKTKVDAPPTKLTDYLDPKWKGRIVMDSTFSTFFAPYGIKHGKDAMVDLMKKLKDSGNLILTSDPDTLLEAGDAWIKFDAQNFTQNPDIAVAAFEDSSVWFDYTGVHRDAKNKPAATIYALWNTFDPDWLKVRTTAQQFAQTSIPYPGIGPEILEHMSPSKQSNFDEYMKALQNGWAIVEGHDNGAAIGAMDDAARAVYK